MPAFRHIPGIDGLRAVSVLLVLLAHWEPSPWFASLMEWGRGGLMVFFTISGFLITNILLNQRESASGSMGAELKTFYARRAFRIFPLYYLVLLFVVWMDLTTAVTEDAGWHALFLNNLSAIFLRGGIGAYGPTFPWWSLAVEEQFYLLWAPLALFVPRRWIVPFITLAAASAFCFRLVGWNSGMRVDTLFVFTLGNLDALGAGCGIAILARSRFASSRLVEIGAATVAVAALAALLTLSAMHRTMGISDFRSTFANAVVSDCAWYLLAAALIFLFATGRNRPLSKILENPVFVYIGRRSYGIYVLHQVVAHTMYLRIGPRLEHLTGVKFQLYGPLEFCVYFAITLALASVSYKYFETPILRMRDGLFRQSKVPAQ